jgi:hypothetical protein
MNKPPEAKRRRAVFVAFAAFWKSGLAEPPVSQARGLQAPAALQSALRRDRRRSCATLPSLNVRQAETSLQAMRATSHRDWRRLVASSAGPRQVFARFVGGWSWHAHGISSGHAFPDWGLHLRCFSCLATRQEHFSPTSLLSPLRHQVAFSSAVLSLIIYASAASRPLAKSASLPRSFLLFALSASATAKQALGQHPPRARSL